MVWHFFSLKKVSAHVGTRKDRDPEKFYALKRS